MVLYIHINISFYLCLFLFMYLSDYVFQRATYAIFIIIAQVKCIAYLMLPF